MKHLKHQILELHQKWQHHAFSRRLSLQLQGLVSALLINLIIADSEMSSAHESLGVIVRAPDCRSRGQWFDSTCCHFEAYEIFFTPLCLCLSEAVGQFYLVSMPGEVKDPMQGNEKTCCGLTNYRELKLLIYVRQGCLGLNFISNGSGSELSSFREILTMWYWEAWVLTWYAEPESGLPETEYTIKSQYLWILKSLTQQIIFFSFNTDGLNLYYILSRITLPY